MSRRRALSSDRNMGRPLSRTERENLAARLAVVGPTVAAGLADLATSAGGRARLRDAGYVSRLSPGEIRTAVHEGAGTPVLPGGVAVDLEAIVAGLRRSERGRAALRARGLDP